MNGAELILYEKVEMTDEKWRHIIQIVLPDGRTIGIDLDEFFTGYGRETRFECWPHLIDWPH